MANTDMEEADGYYGWLQTAGTVISTGYKIISDPNVQKATNEIIKNVNEGNKDPKAYIRAVSDGTISSGARVAHPYISMALFAIVATIAQKIVNSIICSIVRHNTGFVFMIVTSVTIGMCFRMLSKQYLSGKRISLTDDLADRIVLCLTLKNLEKMFEKSHWSVSYLILFGISGLMFFLHFVGLTIWIVGETIFVFTINLGVAQFFL